MNEMISKAECIAVVNITNVEQAADLDQPLIEGKRWPYAQKAIAEVESSVKGDVKGKIEIYGFELVKGAKQCQFAKGRFLLFLATDQTADGTRFWVGSNGQVGVRPIDDDKVLWFKNDRVITGDSELTNNAALSDVLTQIKGVLSGPKAGNAPSAPEHHLGLKDAGAAGGDEQRLRRRLEELTRKLENLAKEQQVLAETESMLREEIRLLESMIETLGMEKDKTGTADKRDAGRPKTRFTKEEAVMLANAEAIRNGIDLKKYNPPRVEFKILDQEGMWTVVYPGKERAKGNYFDVRVNDRTGECRLTPGE